MNSRLRSRTARGAAVVLAMTVVGVVSPGRSGAQTVDEQESLVQQITDELEALEERSDILAEDYTRAMDEQHRLEGEIAAAEQRVAEKSAEVDALSSQLAAAAVRTYMGASSNSLGPLFSGATAATDNLARDQLSSVAMSAGTASTDELEEAVSDLDDERDHLDDVRNEAVAKADEVKEAKQATDERKAEYVETRAEAEVKLGRLIQEEEERRARESFERMQAAAAQAQADADAAARTQRQASDSGGTNQQATAPASGGGGGGGGDDDDSGGDVLAVAAPAASRAPVPQASSRAGTAVNAAMSQLGVPYVGYQASPGVGFDCSGLTSWAWAQAGVGMPHQSGAQFGSFPQVPIESAQPGDLLFFYSPISHVSMYIGGGQQVHAPNTGDVVKVGSVNWGKVVGVARPG